MSEINLKRINNWLGSHINGGNVLDMLKDFEEEDFISWAEKQENTYWILKDPKGYWIEIIHIIEINNKTDNLKSSRFKISIHKSTYRILDVIDDISTRYYLSEIYNNKIKSVKISKESFKNIYHDLHNEIPINKMMNYLTMKYIDFKKNDKNN